MHFKTNTFRNSGSNTCDIAVLLPVAAVFIMKGFNTSNFKQDGKGK